MNKLIELSCECGELLKVPIWRSLQSGKCRHCSRRVTIPSAIDSKDSFLDSSEKDQAFIEGQEFTKEEGQEFAEAEGQDFTNMNTVPVEYESEKVSQIEENLYEDYNSESVEYQNYDADYSNIAQEEIVTEPELDYGEVIFDKPKKSLNKSAPKGSFVKFLFLNLLVLFLGMSTGLILGPSYLNILTKDFVNLNEFVKFSFLGKKEIVEKNDTKEDKTKKEKNTGKKIVKKKIKLYPPLDNIGGEWFNKSLKLTYVLEKMLKDYKNHRDIINIILRSGNDIKNYKKKFENLAIKMHDAQKKGKNIFTWISKRKHFDKLNLSEKDKLKIFQDFAIEGKIKILVDDIFATLKIYYPKLRKEYNSKSIKSSTLRIIYHKLKILSLRLDGKYKKLKFIVEEFNR